MISIIIFIVAAICIAVGILEMLGRLKKVAEFGIPKATLERLDMEKFVRAEGLITLVGGLVFLATGLLWNTGHWMIARAAAICAAAVMVIGLWVIIRKCGKID